jgi:hypothetical protein
VNSAPNQHQVRGCTAMPIFELLLSSTLYLPCDRRCCWLHVLVTWRGLIIWWGQCSLVYLLHNALLLKTCAPWLRRSQRQSPSQHSSRWQVGNEGGLLGLVLPGDGCFPSLELYWSPLHPQA